MKPHFPKDFEQNYQTHLKRLKLNGMQPKTIEAYSLAMRRAGEYFEYQIDALTEPQLTEYFADLLESHSWSTVKHDLYGLKFYYAHVLHQPWVAPNLIKPPRVQRLPDIVTVEEAERLFTVTHTLSYRVFFFTLYSMGSTARRRACGWKWGILMPRANGSIFAMPRATGIVSCRYLQPR